MIRSLPNSRRYLYSYKLYMALYFAFLFAPLVVTCVLAFNDSQFPALPWKGFTLEWFTADLPHRVGIFHDRMNLESIWVSAKVAFFVTLLSVTVGTCAAFLFEQEEFPFKGALYFLMLSPLVIPGVILGISILLFSNTLGLYFEEHWGIDVPLFRPGFWLVVLGQFSFIATLVTLVVSARLRKFDRTLEEAALNLGANRFEARPAFRRGDRDSLVGNVSEAVGLNHFRSLLQRAIGQSRQTGQVWQGRVRGLFDDIHFLV